MGGWMGGSKSRVKDCLQQSKSVPIPDISDFRQLGPPIWMLYGPDFSLKKVSKIGTVWEWDRFLEHRDPNVLISDVYCIVLVLDV